MQRKPHTERSYDADLNRIQELLSIMSARDLDMLSGSLHALELRDRALARRVVAADGEIDSLEKQIDQRCLELLARWQPVASDLRFVASALKVVTDLERVGDHCVSICQRVLELSAEEELALPAQLTALGLTAEDLLRDAVSALRAGNVRLALQVIEQSQRVDAVVDAGPVLQACLRGDSDQARPIAETTRLYQFAGYLQRIAAHAANIAEMVIFRVHGRDIRHQPGLVASDEAAGP